MSILDSLKERCSPEARGRHGDLPQQLLGRADRERLLPRYWTTASENP